MTEKWYQSRKPTGSMCLLTRQVNYFLSCNRFSDQEIDDMLHGAPVDSKGMFDYVKFTRIIKHGKDDD